MAHRAIRLRNAIQFGRMDGAVGSIQRTAVQRFHFSGQQFLLAFIGISLILRLIAIALVPLIPEEAYYWMYAQHPSLSYFDHPPMVAWVTAAGTFLFGDTELGVRIVGNLLNCAAVAIMYIYTRQWLGRTTARASALLLLILPLYLSSGFINTMNSQLLFFWLVALAGASLALRRGKTWGWYLAGFGLGGALLSKYTGIFVGGGLLLALLAHRPWRRFLRSPHPYLAALLGIAMFSPVLLWNYRHGWASFRFQFVDRSEAHPLKSWSSLTSPLNFIGLQMAAVTPVFLFICYSAFRRIKSAGRLLRRPLFILAACTSIPMLVAMAWKSILLDVHFDWTAPLYLSLFPIVCREGLARLRLSRWKRPTPYWTRTVGLSLGACIGFNVGAYLFLVFLQPVLGHPDVFGPWKTLASVVQRYELALEKDTGREPLIIGRGKYRLASELAFYRSEIEKPVYSSAFTTSEWFLGDVEGLGYSYWLDRPNWKGRDCIFVSDKDDINAIVRDRFEHVRLIDDPQLRHQPGGLTYHLAICRGFKG